MNHGMIGHARTLTGTTPALSPQEKFSWHPPQQKKKSLSPSSSKKSRTQKKHPAQSAAQDLTNIPDIDLARAEKTVLELLKIPGISGQEKQVAEFIRKKLLDAGCSKNFISFDQAHKKTPLKGTCGNLIVKFPGTRRGPRRLLMAHMDTVPVCEGTKPVLRGDIVKSGNPETGLGADDRSGCGVVLSTALEILRKKIDHPPLTFFFAIQEEVGLWGARTVKANDLGKPKLAFNFDGGDVDKLTIGATGGERLDITIEGIPSHAGVRQNKVFQRHNCFTCHCFIARRWLARISGEKIEEGNKQYWGHSGGALRMSSQKVLLCGLRQEGTTPSFEIELFEQLKSL